MRLILPTMRALGLIWLACAFAVPSMRAQTEGGISGVVVDAKGTPQMGASVLIAAEQPGPTSLDLLTNGRGRFSTASLTPGSYTVKVTLAGFLPAMEQHIHVSNDHVTLLQVVMGSVFSSFGQLRRQTDQKISDDDWTWVLRSSPDTQSVLRWTEGPVLTDAQMSGTDAAAQKHEDRMQMQLTSGADHPGSIGAAADSPTTAVVYDLGVGATARLLMAGEFSYGGNSAPDGGFAAEWLPSGEAGAGPVMVLEAREAQLGPMGPVFRGMRLSDSNKLALGDRVSIRYGADFLAAGFNGTTQSLRPHGELAVHLASNWLATMIVSAATPEETAGQDPLRSTLESLDEFPVLMMRDGRPVLENDWHEELGIDHALSKDADISAAVFHDRSTHTAVIGRGNLGKPDFLQDYFSDAFAYDGGFSSSTGVRVAYRQRFNDNLSASLVYAYAGALGPNDEITGVILRDELTTVDRQSVAGRVTAIIPHLGTHVSTGYKWISGAAVSQVDGYGESVYHIDPYLSMEVRQPLPKSLPCHMEVMADVGNLLAQGYVPMTTPDGRVLLVPSYRFFRGGLSLQF